MSNIYPQLKSQYESNKKEKKNKEVSEKNFEWFDVCFMKRIQVHGTIKVRAVSGGHAEDIVRALDNGGHLGDALEEASKEALEALNEERLHIDAYEAIDPETDEKVDSPLSNSDWNLRYDAECDELVDHPFSYDGVIGEV